MSLRRQTNAGRRSAGGLTTGVDPRVLGSCIGWWSADHSANVLSGANLVTLVDRVGSNNGSVVGTGNVTYSATGWGGARPALATTSANMVSTDAGAVANGAGAFTCVMAFDALPTGAFNVIAGFASAVGNLDYCVLCHDGSGNLAVQRRSTSGGPVSRVLSTEFSGRVIIAWGYDGTQVFGHLLGGSRTEIADSISPANQTRFSLGGLNRLSPLYYAGDISEVWLFDEAIADCSDALAAMASRWPVLSGDYVFSAAIDSRTGFDTDTVLPEFASSAAPERTDAVNTSFSLTEVSGAITGSYTDSSNITASVTGTYTASTGAVAFSGSCDGFDVGFSGTYGASGLSGTVTVERGSSGASSEDRTMPATLKGGSAITLGTAYYVDSIDGSDVNNGTSPATPKQTLAALPTINAGDTIRLARGSRWREELSVGEVTVEAYGVGPRPIIDSATIYASGSWSLNSGNVYEASVTPVQDDDGCLIVLQNGIALLPVADLATCNSTEGSFVNTVTDSGGGPYTALVHRRGGGAPTGNEMEISTSRGLLVSGSATVRSVMTRCSLSNIGSLRVTQVDTNDAPTLWDCVALWGGKHNIITSAGTADHCAAVGWIRPTHTQSTAWVVNRNVGSDLTFVGDDIAAIQFPDNETQADGGSAFLAHTNSSGSYASVTIRNSGFSHATGGNGPSNVTLFTYENCVFEEPRGSNGSYWINGFVNTVVSGCRFYSHVSGDSRFGAAQSDGVAEIRVDNSIVYGQGTTRFFRVTELDRVSVYRTGAVTSTFLNAVTTPVDVNNCLFASHQHAFLTASGSAPGPYSGDYNLIHDASTVVRYTGDTSRAFSVYQVVESVNDLNSLNWSSPSNMTYGPAFDGGSDSSALARPTLIHSAAFDAAVPFQVGPDQCQNGGPGWSDPVTHDAWKAFLAGL